MPAPRGHTRRVSDSNNRRPQGYGYGESAKSAAVPRLKKHGTNGISGRARLSAAPLQSVVDADDLDIALTETRLQPSRKSSRRKVVPQDEENEDVDITFVRDALPPGRRSNRKERPSTRIVPAPEAKEAVQTQLLSHAAASEACLLRDAELLEAWSRGETLIIEDEVQIEQGNGLAPTEGDLSLGTKARRLRKRVKRRVRRIEEGLLATEIDAENFVEEDGQPWWSENLEVGGDTDLNEALEIQAEQEFGEEGEEEVELVEDGEVEFLEDIEDMEFDQEVLDEDDPFDLEELSEQEAMAEEAEEEEEEQHTSTASLVPASQLSQDQEGPPLKRARLVPEKSRTLAAVARLRSRPQLVPAVGAESKGEKRKALTPPSDSMQVRYLPPHEKRRRIELAKWKEIKAAWHRKLIEEEAQGPRKQKAGPNMRALARRFEATLEELGSFCFNQLQKDDSIQVSSDGLRAQCDPSSSSTGPNVTASGGIKGLPLVAGGKYQYEVELRRGCSLVVGWSPALVLPSSVASSGRSAARRMLGYSSDGELIGEGCLIEVPSFGRQGDVVGALLDWQEGSCGPRLSFMLNGRNLGMAFDLRAEGVETPPLQLHICQGQGRPFSVLLRGASQQAPLRFPKPGYRPLGNIAEQHFSPFSKAVELATSTETGAVQQKPPPAAARRLIHSSLGLALPLPHVAQEKSLGKTLRPQSRIVTRQDDLGG